MQLGENRSVHSRSAAFFGTTIAAFAAAIALASCGMPGAPLPPSLNLPVPVNDLSAVRTGDQVALTWTMPAKTTDKVLLKGNITVRVCRNEPAATRCSVATTLQLAPKADASFTDTLPSQLAAGPPRVLTYFVELVNRKGRSAGPSNSATVLAGEAPPAIENLTAQMRKDGVLLHWASAPTESSPVAVRLVRRLLTPPAKKSEKSRARWRSLLNPSSKPSWSKPPSPQIMHPVPAPTPVSTTTFASARPTSTAPSVSPASLLAAQHSSSPGRYPLPYVSTPSISFLPARPKVSPPSPPRATNGSGPGHRSQLASRLGSQSRRLHRLSPRPRCPQRHILAVGARFRPRRLAAHLSRAARRRARLS